MVIFTNGVKLKLAHTESILTHVLVKMLYTFGEPTVFTFRVIVSQIVSFVTFSVDIFHI